MALDRAAQAIGQRQLRARFVIDLIGMEAVTAATGVLGAIQRLVGLREQLIWTVRIGTIQRDAMLTPMCSWLPAMSKGAETISMTFSASLPADAESTISVCTMANSSPPRRATTSLSPRRLPQTRRDLLQQQISALMAERVVDLLETIQIQIQHGEGICPAL